MPFLEPFSVVLLDMNGTFMFDHDRFGPEQDYFVTYQVAGGRGLDRNHVQHLVHSAFSRLSIAYSAPDRVDDFPSVTETLRELEELDERELEELDERELEELDERELLLLESVLATHELGSVPPAHERFLHQLALSHSLGIVSNIWSRPEPWLAAFHDSGLLSAFKTVVFSSEGRSIKPSRVLFDRARTAFSADAKILFVGDSLERDIVPAKALGLSTAWIAPAGSAHLAADVVIQSLIGLAEAGAPSTTEPGHRT